MTATSAPEINLRWAQGQVFNNEKRFRLLVAGRRFGKSYLSCIELLRGAIERPGETYFYCAPTYRMAKDIAWKALKKLVPNELKIEQELEDNYVIIMEGIQTILRKYNYKNAYQEIKEFTRGKEINKKNIMLSGFKKFA